MQTYTIKYNRDGYNSPLPVGEIQVRALTERNALANAVKRIGARRGAIAEARRSGGRIRIGTGSYHRNLWAWVYDQKGRAL